MQINTDSIIDKMMPVERRLALYEFNFYYYFVIKLCVR